MAYSQNYSYQGMNNVASMGGGVIGEGGRPSNNNHDTASIISGVSDSTVRPGMAHGATARNGSPFPPPPPQNHAQYGAYGPGQQQQMYPPQPPAWQPPQHQQPPYDYGAGHAGPSAPGTEVGDYESYGGRPPMPPQQPPQMQRPAAHAGRPHPPPRTSGYDSDSSSDGYTATTGAGTSGRRDQSSKFSFLESLKQSLKHVGLMDILPLAGMIGAGIFHYYKNRGSKNPEPYREPSWMQYMATAAPLAQVAFGQMGGNKQHGRPSNSNKHGRPSAHGGGGISSAIPWTALISTLAGTMMGSSNRPHGRPHGGSGYGSYGGNGSYGGYGGRPPMNASNPYSSFTGGRPSVGGGGYQSSQFGGGGPSADPISKVMGKIMGSLFKGKTPAFGAGTRDLETSSGATNILRQFDDSWAVQRFVAEHYYRHVYRKKMDLRNASAQTLGGAAAIRALREESRMSVMLTPDNPSVPKDLPYDQIVMGMALSEVSDLLERKAAVGPLHPEESLEFVGKIALATIIKIKIDEEAGPRKSASDQRLHSSHRDAQSSASSSGRRKHRHKHEFSSSSADRHRSHSSSAHRDSHGHRHHRSSRHDYESSSVYSSKPRDFSDPASHHSRPIVDPYAH
ncbi:hypothetical protein H4217_002784 [Coemansia sp. RSA 1939]|nr:hypothetical protein H4217_002784 [Coemansia sp. RSA 1939]